MQQLWRAAGAAVAVAMAIASSGSSAAGQPDNGVDVGIGLPPRADTGKPALVMPPAELIPSDPGSCEPLLPCGTRLLGEIRKDGAVELQVPVLRW